MEFVLNLLIFVGIPMIICVVPGLILATIILRLIKKKLNRKSENFKELMYAIIVIFCLLISVIFGSLFIEYKSAEPNKLYVEMNKINDDQSLIGLSKEQVVELLGNPYKKINNEDRNIYEYDAGKITNHFFFGERDFYTLKIFFDESDIVKDTSIKMVT